ncbi:MAG TPA: hypothetical protein VKA06_06720, partial [Spirochaetia bacterium]|nr:hypothetical protein [Spirochaetia bacterium]
MSESRVPSPHLEARTGANDMGLKSEIEKFNVDMDAIARIRKRVFVVGRFNQHRQVDNEPGIYLFSNRSDLSPGYLRNFTAHSTLDYESFVEALQPAIAEKVEYGKRHPLIVQGIPGSEEDLETSFVIDLFNYFFDRAVRHSDQPEFRTDHSDSDPELLQREERERGKGILQQVRRDLRSFSRFQHRNGELVEEAAKVIAKCSGVNGLPAYAYAGALPGGFPEALIDFLYSEEQYAKFDATELEFTGEWATLANDDSARARFEDVVTAFRDAAIDWEHLRFAEMFAGQPLHAQVRTSDRALLDEFRKARAAVNRLRQILRSKVLLSMILEWVIESLNDLPSVREIDADDKHARNEQMGRAILEEWESNGLARPVKRPSREERRRFEAELCAGFEDVVRGIVVEGEEASSDVVSGLSEELRELVATLRKDTGTVDALRMMAGSDGDGDRVGAFVDANQTVLRDVMCPTLFRTPLVSPTALRRDL